MWRIRALLFLAAFSAALMLGPGDGTPLPQLGTQAAAFVLPPPPPPPKPAADTGNHGGNRYRFGTQAAVQAGACLLGNGLLYAGDASPNDYLLWNIVCAVGGPIGGGAALALFQKDDGLVSNFLNDNWKCHANDKRDRCKVWVQQHSRR